MSQMDKKVVGRSEGPSRIVIEVEDFEGVQPDAIIVEQPPSLSREDRGANPSDHLLAGLVGSLNWLGYLIAEEMKFKINSLTITAGGTMDPSAAWGESYEQRPGFQAIRVMLDVDADAEEDRLELWRKALLFRCPVADNFLNPTRLKIRFLGQED